MAAPVKLLDAHAAERRDAAWLAARRRGIGASEIAAVLGINPPEWDSPFSLWWKKTDPSWDDPDSDRFRVARRLEPVVVDEWRDRYGQAWDVWPGGLYRHAEHEWMLATPDRLLTPSEATHEPGCRAGTTYVDEESGAEMVVLCSCLPDDPDRPDELLECKTSGSYDGWGEEGTDDIPPHYLAQARWQRLVMDVARVRVAVMFLPACKLREYVIEPDPDDEKLMQAAGAQFMTSLAEGDPPAPDWTPATTRTLKRLHPKVEEVDVEVPAELRDRYLGAIRNETAASRARKQAENELRDRIGDGWRAVCDGKRVATRSVFPQRRIDAERLRRERPDVATEYTVESEVSRLTPRREETK